MGGGGCRPTTEKFISALFFSFFFWSWKKQPGRAVGSFWLESNLLSSCADLPASLPKQTPPPPAGALTRPLQGHLLLQHTPQLHYQLFRVRELPEEFLLVFHLHCKSKTTIAGRHRDVPPIIVLLLRAGASDPGSLGVSSHTCSQLCDHSSSIQGASGRGGSGDGAAGPPRRGAVTAAEEEEEAARRGGRTSGARSLAVGSERRRALAAVTDENERPPLLPRGFVC